jgi:hypothetical protein
MTRYLALLLLVASWMVPVHFLPWVSWQNEVLAFIAVMLLAWSGVHGLVQAKGLGSVPIPVSALPFLLLGLIVSVQKAVGLLTFGGDALVVSFYAVLCVVCVSLGHSLGAMMASGLSKSHGSDPGPDAEAGATAVSLMAVALLVGAFISTIVAFAQVLELWEGVDWVSRMPTLRRPGANLGQPNQLASLIIMGLTSLLYLLESKKLSVITAILLQTTLTAGLAITESRTGVLSYFGVLIWFFVKHRQVSLRLPRWVALTSVLCFTFMFWIWPTLLDAIQLVGNATESVVNTKAGTRLLLWSQLLDSVMLRPWWGWGVGRVSDALTAVVYAYPESEAFTYSHNIVLDMAVGIGLPVTAIAVVFAARWSWLACKAVDRLLPWYCMSVAIPVGVHSMLEFPFAYAYFLAPVVLLLGVVDGVYSPRSRFRVNLPAVAAALLAITVVMVWSVVEYVGIEEDFRVLRFEALRIGVTPPDYERPQVILLTQLDALLYGGRIRPRPSMSEDEIDLARRVALRFPWPATQNRYALTLALNRKPEEAVRQLKVIRAMHGNASYDGIRDNWRELSNTKYPQLRTIDIP